MSDGSNMFVPMKIGTNGNLSVGTTATPYGFTLSPNHSDGAGMAIGWNSLGVGNTDFYNYGQNGTGGFAWLNYGLVGASWPTTGATQLMTLDSDGHLGVGMTHLSTRSLSVLGAVSAKHNGTFPTSGEGNNGQYFAHNNGTEIAAVVPYAYDSSNFGAVIKGYTNTTLSNLVYVKGWGGLGMMGINVLPSYQLQLSSDSAAKPNGGSWTNPSDRRLKENIRPFSDGLDIVNQLHPVAYELNGKAGLPAGLTGIGLIAQDAADVVPYAVGTYKAKLNPGDTEEQDIYNMNPSSFTYLLINAIQDLQKQTVRPVDVADIEPACSEALRSQTRFVKDDVLGDVVKACGRNASGEYGWFAVASAPINF